MATLTKGFKISDGKEVKGELFTWSKYRPVAIILEAHHTNISEGHRVDPFKLTTTKH